MKSFLETADGAAPFDRATPIHPVQRQTDGQAPEVRQHHRRIGMAHPAAILVQADVQGVVQPAFNGPVEPLVLQEAARVQFGRAQAGDEINRFGVTLCGRRMRRTSRAMVRAPGNPTWAGVTSRAVRTRISRRPRLRSRVPARVWAVGGGGKTLLGEQGG